MPPKVRKICVMGYSRVGKSSLTIQFVNDYFVDAYEPTISNTFYKSFVFKKEHYSMEVMDTAGQDEYTILPTAYSSAMDGYILVYDITNKKSFEVCKVIFEKLLDLMGESCDNHVPIVLVGNMKDKHTSRVISTDQGKALAAEWKCEFMESSAKLNENVNLMFENLLLQIDRRRGVAPTTKSDCSVM